jgi:hypothetical protein
VVPAEDRVRAGDARDLAKTFATERASDAREPSSVAVGDADASAELLPEDAVLLLQVFDRPFLVARDPRPNPGGGD